MAAVERCVAWLTGRTGAVVLLTAAWVMVIATSAGRAAEGDAWIGLPDTDIFTYLFAGAMVSGVVFVLFALVTVRGSGGTAAARRPSIWPILLLVLLFVVLGQRNVDELADVDMEPVPEQAQLETPPDEPLNPSSGIGGGELLVLVLMLGASAAVLLWTHTRSPGEADPQVQDDGRLETMLGPAVAEAGRHLLTETDPRTAVLLAYAGLEAALTGAGYAPGDHETPGEHLRRVLGQLSIDAKPLFRLAELYHLARFSTHVITPAQQQDAAASLDRVRSELVPTL